MVSLVALVTFAFGIAPTAAQATDGGQAALASPEVAVSAQSLNTLGDTSTLPALSTVLELSAPANASHGFDVEATIAAATAEVGTSRATGWGQPGECIVSAQRWIQAGGGAWTGGGDPVSNYTGALRLPLSSVQRGDIIQYEHIAYPTSWVSGVHTVLVTGVNDDGTLAIIESNNPGGSGLVGANEHWTPQPPAGFQAVVWRF